MKLKNSLPIKFDEEADCIASYYAAVAELRRRYLAGESMPEGWNPKERMLPTPTAEVDVPKLIELCRAGLAWTAIGERLNVANSTAMKYWDRHRTTDDAQARFDALEERGRIGRQPDRGIDRGGDMTLTQRFDDDPRAVADRGSPTRLHGRPPRQSLMGSSAAMTAGLV